MKIIEENCIERTQRKKRLLTLDLKPFISHLIPEFGCARKETVDIEILITSRRTVDRKIMQPIRITSVTATRMRKWNQFRQFR